MPPLQDAQVLERLLEQAQERLDPIAQVDRADDASWWVGFHNGGGFSVEWSAPWACVVFTADLGLPPPGGELAALNLALSYNALWREVGHLRIARDGDQGELMLIGELGPDDGDPDTFNAALLHFESLQRWWSEALARAAQPAGTDAATGIDQALLLGRI
jgi:hypothetical protein